MRPHIVFAVAALLAALAVVLGAFGAHGLQARLSIAELSTYQTATDYLLYHALALLAIAAYWRPFYNNEKPTMGLMIGLMLLGVALFSGSLYLLLLTEQRWLVWLTPLGGLTLIIAWFGVAWQGLKLGQDVMKK